MGSMRRNDTTDFKHNHIPQELGAGMLDLDDAYVQEASPNQEVMIPLMVGRASPPNTTGGVSPLQHPLVQQRL